MKNVLYYILLSFLSCTKTDSINYCDQTTQYEITPKVPEKSGFEQNEPESSNLFEEKQNQENLIKNKLDQLQSFEKEGTSFFVLTCPGKKPKLILVPDKKSREILMENIEKWNKKETNKIEIKELKETTKKFIDFLQKKQKS